MFWGVCDHGCVPLQQSGPRGRMYYARDFDVIYVFGGYRSQLYNSQPPIIYFHHVTWICTTWLEISGCVGLEITGVPDLKWHLHPQTRSFRQNLVRNAYGLCAQAVAEGRNCCRKHLKPLTWKLYRVAESEWISLTAFLVFKGTWWKHKEFSFQLFCCSMKLELT